MTNDRNRDTWDVDLFCLGASVDRVRERTSI
jgi:hypothetical protein